MVATPSMDLPGDAHWRHSFDTAEGGDGGVNQGLGLADAFVGFMSDAGVRADQVSVAVVVHGPAILDVVVDERRRTTLDGADNPNVELVERIVDAGGEIWVCARSAENQDIGDGHLLPGVRFAPSAMVANADLQRRGFTLNPY